MKKDAFAQIESTHLFVEETQKKLKQIGIRLAEEQNRSWFPEDRLTELKNVIDKLDVVCRNLAKPCLKIAFIGTTSSGKSTLLNGLSGHRIAPMDADEMSAGVLRIRNGNDMSFNVHDTPGMTWRAGNYKVENDEDIYNVLRSEAGIMKAYREALKKSTEVVAPEIDITVQLAPKRGGVLDYTMPEKIDLEFYDLPGIKTVTDSRNLEVIQKHLADAFLLIVLNYSDTDSVKRGELLSEIGRTVESVCRNKDALLFVLNRVDERNEEDAPLEERVTSLQEDIKKKLKLTDMPLVIPMSALPLYYIQAAWGAEEQPIYMKSDELVKKSASLMENFFNDCGKIIDAIAKQSDEKKEWFKGHDYDAEEVERITEGIESKEEKKAKTNLWLKGHNFDNLGHWDNGDFLLLRGWVYEYSGAKELWAAIQRKLDENVGAVIINPALAGVPAQLDQFTASLCDTVRILGINTQEEIIQEKEKINNLLKTVKESIAVSKSRFVKDFSESVEACRKREVTAHEGIKYKELAEMKTILVEISDDTHDTIMVPIHDALKAANPDASDALQHKLAEVVPEKIAINIRRAVDGLLMGKYGKYAMKTSDNVFECKVEEKEKYSKEISERGRIEESRMVLAGYVDKALLSRSQLLLQRKLGYFSGVVGKIVKNSMDEQFSVLQKSLVEYAIKWDSIRMPAANGVDAREINLGDDVFSRITIAEAEKVMEKTISERY